MGACDSTKRTNVKNHQSKNTLSSREETPVLPKLKRRPRLYSDRLNYPKLENLNIEEDNNNEDINDRYRTPKNKYFSLAFQRKQSMQYCSEFKQNNQIHNNNRLLIHLANSLSRNIIDQNDNCSNYRPEFIIDWRIVKNERTNLYMWKNFGKIPLNTSAPGGNNGCSPPRG